MPSLTQKKKPVSGRRAGKQTPVVLCLATTPSPGFYAALADAAPASSNAFKLRDAFFEGMANAHRRIAQAMKKQSRKGHRQ
jgi:hypothetical protein